MTNPEDLGVGRLGWRASAALVFFAGLVALGAWCYHVQHHEGAAVTGLGTIGRGGAAWGLEVVFLVYFVDVSFAGMAVAVLVRVFEVKTLRPLSRTAELLAVVSLPLAGLSALAGLGRPLEAVIHLPRYARAGSPFYGTFTLAVGGYLAASLVHLHLAGRADAAHLVARGGKLRFLYRLWATGFQGTPAEHNRHHSMAYWQALAILPFLVAAHSTLGVLFGSLPGRPGWYGPLQAPGFVLLAAASGVAVLIQVGALLRRALGLWDVMKKRAFIFLGNLLAVLVLANLYLMVAEATTSLYASSAAESQLAREVTSGRYATLFCLAAGSMSFAFAILFLQFAAGRHSMTLTVAGAIATSAGAILRRYLLVVPSQTHGMLLPYPEGAYAPTWVELGVVAGLVGLGGLAFTLFVKVFPIVPVVAEPAPAVPHVGRDGWARLTLRFALAGLTFLGGVALAAIGFAASARSGTEPGLDPAVPYAPAVFLAGVVMIFLLPAVYEILPPAPRVRRP